MTAEISPADEWATLDELLGVDTVVDDAAGLVGRVAFYGRCSTEDKQDPETSYGWQRSNAAKFVEPLGGQIVAEYFDVDQSRSVTWERREHGSRLLAGLKNPARGWDAVVVGEGTRCWFGNQFSLTAPRFAAHGVELWVPELGGRFDPRNPSHKMLMSVLGGMSESERQHVQARVRAAMDTQVVNEGRHQGGRAPYGYVAVDGGPHPNPSKAAEGHRLRVLAIDEPAAEVVRRIFAEYLDGSGDRAIAAMLNRDGIPCPSAHRPEQNRHRHRDGWQASAIRAVLENPRYTGYAVFGRSTRHETLIDPEDVAAGYTTRFRRAESSTVVRSRKPAHPAVVSVETFTQAQLRRRGRSAGGMAGMAKTERTRTRGTRPYLLRGLVRCGLCSRKMQAAAIRNGVYYRCLARTLAPGSAVLEDHPKTVNLREDVVAEALNGWIGRLFSRENRDTTVRALAAVQGTDRGSAAQRALLERTVADARERLRRNQAAIDAGIDPAAIAEAMNEAYAAKQVAEAELEALPKNGNVTEAEIYAMIDSFGDVDDILANAKQPSLARLYEKIRPTVRYEPRENTLYIAGSPRVFSVCVGGVQHALVAAFAPQLMAA